jgi:hypothetical protein
MDTSEIEVNIPAKEPGLDDRTTFGDNETHAETVDANQAEQIAAASRNALPFWISEKFHWKTSGSGRSYLSPNPEFLAAITEDAHKAGLFGITRVEEAKSTESVHVKQLVKELTPVLHTLEAIDTREANDFSRWLIERATRNACYSAITQFELVQWTERAAKQGKDASEHSSFGTKQSRMESFASAAGVFRAVAMQLLPQADLGDVTYAKMAKRLIYQQADMNTRDLNNPADVDANEKAVIDGAIAAVKLF